MNRSEKETVITLNDADSVVRVWTAQRSVISHYLKHVPTAVVVGHGEWEGSAWYDFEIPATEWSAWAGFKRHRAPMTDEQKSVASDRLKRARASRGEPVG